MSFSKAIVEYLNAEEINSPLYGLKLQKVLNIIQNTTFDELNTQYNILSQQNLWVEPLIDVFYDELLRRVMSSATFAISTAWSTIDEWENYPFVYIRVGFEDIYYITNSDGSFIDTGSESMNVTAITNDSLPNEKVEMCLRLFLNREIMVTVQSHDNQIEIIGMENKYDSSEYISFAEENPIYKTIKIPAKMYELKDFNIIRRMLDGLRTQSFEIVVPSEQI